LFSESKGIEREGGKEREEERERKREREEEREIEKFRPQLRKPPFRSKRSRCEEQKEKKKSPEHNLGHQHFSSLQQPPTDPLPPPTHFQRFLSFL